MTRLASSMLLPDARISRMVTGQVEAYRAKIGFTDPELTDKPAGALWLHFEGEEYKSHEFLIGGPPLNIKFKTEKFFGLAGRDGVEVVGKIDPSAVKFRRNSSVSTWKTLEATFPGTLSFPGAIIDVSKGPVILTRFRIVMGQNGRMELIFEGIILPEGKVLESLPMEARQTLEKAAAKTFLLWKVFLVPHCPSSLTGLPLTPGLYLKEDGNPPSDPAIRFALSWVTEFSRRRSHFKAAADYDGYIENPVSAKAEKTKFAFVVESEANPNFTSKSGGSAQSNSANSITIWGGKRKGLVIDIERRKRARKCVSIPQPTAPPKFSTLPHPLLRLSRAALPAETPEEIYDKAVGHFSASVSHNTQTVYCTTAKHMAEAEKLLGMSFSCPPTGQEQLYFLTFLQGKPLKSETVSNYMSAFRQELLVLLSK